MYSYQIKCNDKINDDQLHTLQRILERLEEIAPSDSNLMIDIFEDDTQHEICGELKINSLMLRLDVIIAHQQCPYKLLETIEKHAKKQINKWKENRKFMEYEFSNV